LTIDSKSKNLKFLLIPVSLAMQPGNRDVISDGEMDSEKKLMISHRSIKIFRKEVNIS